MEQVGYFTKADTEQFLADMSASLGAIEHNMDSEDIRYIARDAYFSVELPRHESIWSAWYDFIAPIRFELLPGESLTIPSGVFVHTNPGWMLELVPHRDHGPSDRWETTRLVSTSVGHYAQGKREGHVLIEIMNISQDQTIMVARGEPFAKGIFLPYGAGRMRA